MNEQFFKLALKAMGFHGAVDTDTELKMTNSELEKFSELIIQECANLCQELAADYAADYAAVANSKFVTEGSKTLHTGMWGGAANCVSEIKQHFGIK